MLDHVFTDAISALRDAFEAAFLERQPFEEHFQADVLLGDLTWETSYGLPGEENPPRVVAHITFDWPSWSQTAYRQWYVEEVLDRLPAIEIEIVFRVQSMAAPLDPSHGVRDRSGGQPAHRRRTARACRRHRRDRLRRLGGVAAGVRDGSHVRRALRTRRGTRSTTARAHCSTTTSVRSAGGSPPRSSSWPTSADRAGSPGRIIGPDRHRGTRCGIVGACPTSCSTR